jgi:uncharacterized MAPEG superfamily protein
MPSRLCNSQAVEQRGEIERELQATLAARKELGPEHDEALIAGFLDRIDREIDRRVEEQLARRSGRPKRVEREAIGVFVPVVIAAGIFGGSTGIVAALAALVIVFVVLNASHR